jgi:hypothetical protein
MHDIFSREPDPLDAMLAPPQIPADAETRRQELFAQTNRLLRRRRHLRRFAHAAALAGSFAAGMLVMWATAARLTPETPIPHANKGEPQPPDNPQPPTQEPALVQEWRAFDRDDHRSEPYRQAGDRYLEDENDVLSALRCYTNSLNNGTEKDLVVSTEDTFLLMAIKNARKKERDHAKTDG